MLELQFEGDRTALELVGRIQQAQSHLHQLLEEVRSYAAPIILDRSPCRISEVWREAWDLLRALREAKRASLREHIEANDLAIEADRFRLVQAFCNLLENSLAASSEDLRIDLTCEDATLGDLPALRVHIRDYGVGLNVEQRRRIFEPFFTTKPTGTGLGTAIAQRMIEAPRRNALFRRMRAAGTEMVVTLPLKAS